MSWQEMFRRWKGRLDETRDAAEAAGNGLLTLLAIVMVGGFVIITGLVAMYLESRGLSLGDSEAWPHVKDVLRTFLIVLGLLFVSWQIDRMKRGVKADANKVRDEVRAETKVGLEQARADIRHDVRGEISPVATTVGVVEEKLKSVEHCVNGELDRKIRENVTAVFREFEGRAETRHRELIEELRRLHRPG